MKLSEVVAQFEEEDKTADHADDRFEERIGTDPKILEEIRKNLHKIPQDGQSRYHLPIKGEDGKVQGYAAIKRVGKGQVPVLATVLGPHMKASGPDVRHILQEGGEMKKASPTEKPFWRKDKSYQGVPDDSSDKDDVLRRETRRNAIEIIRRALDTIEDTDNRKSPRVGRIEPDRLAPEKLPEESTEKWKSKLSAMKTRDFQGITVRLDRPKGTVQKGKDAEGNPWTRTYAVDYGFIPKTQGGDGDGLDVFLGPHEDADEAYWISQHKEDGSFDEYKIVLGAESKGEAIKIYTDHIPKRFMGSIAVMKLPMMKAMLGIEPAEKVAMRLAFLDELQRLSNAT